MRLLSNMFTTCATACFVLAFFASRASAYFMITEPHRETQWVNGATNAINWKKGVLDGIAGFDVELARMSVDGLTLVARNVPEKPPSLNIVLQDVPAGDDYFLIFINSTHGVMYATSPRFAILASGGSASGTVSPDPSVPTVTVSGSPHPTMQFATTFPVLESNAGISRWGTGDEFAGRVGGLLAVIVAVVGGAVWTVGW
ncbi:hypothetical protein BDQ12DRAFT_682136 [Crucibulum laeve]|uniref:Ser-Thr-rich glycosyl-phosphatidyl-inositol-anchored membrane family-domain-containing protein n=1 Tax=Crucibulum laeve TaxID=68775 RepID=A0A5C3M320_9AGAR|nr:hypothetical protein BDQ12DRAFT_682136 [Crucibulum laeve]